MLRIVWIAVLVTLFLLVFPAASSSGNHQILTDATGDQTQGYAYTPDITSVDVTSGDNGDLTFRISMNELAGTYYVGDILAVFIDRDLNASTGLAGIGAETGLYVYTSTGKLDFELCNYRSDGTKTCDSFSPQGASDAKTGTNSHLTTFSLSTADPVVRFLVFAFHQDPNNSSAPTYGDLAPDSGMYQYDLGDDLDHDGVAGYADKCPTVPGGRLDADKSGVKDGCPPLLPKPEWTYGHAGSGRYVLFSSFAVTNANAGTSVTARFPGLTARRRGSGPLRAIAGHRFRIGSVVSVIYTNKDYFGRYRVARIGAGGLLQEIRTGCTMPGRPTFTDCPSP